MAQELIGIHRIRLWIECGAKAGRDLYYLITKLNRLTRRTNQALYGQQRGFFASQVSQYSDEFIAASEELRFFAADLRQPYCGPAQFPEILEWFGESAAHLASLALIPLRRDAQVFGMLALGSEDPQRFFPEMGTMYVERIGDLVGAAVLKQIG